MASVGLDWLWWTCKKRFHQIEKGELIAVRFVGVIVLVFCGQATAAEQLYKAEILMLIAPETPITQIIESTSDGVTYDVCRLERRSWLAGPGKAMKDALSEPDENGFIGSLSVKCKEM